MSASNWAICPRCAARAKVVTETAEAAPFADYGKIPVAEFDERRAQIPVIDREDFRTFREDYEIYGAETGTVKVSYGGSCEVCGLELSFTEEKPIAGVTS
jgi:hypothetical protein